MEFLAGFWTGRLVVGSVYIVIVNDNGIYSFQFLSVRGLL